MLIYRLIRHLKEKKCMPPVASISLDTIQTMMEQRTVVAKHNFLKFLFFALITEIATFIPSKIDGNNDYAISVITALAVLAGFLMTLILYTGSTDHIEVLNFDATEKLSKKIKQLLRFQVITFFLYIATILSAVISLLFSIGAIRFIIDAITFIGMVYSFLYSIALPLQLYELHNNRLDEVIKAKKKIREDIIDSKKNSLEAELHSMESNDFGIN